MNREEHIKIHKELHESLDRLLADWIYHNKGILPTKELVGDLMKWSYEQTKNPTEDKE